MGAGLRWQARTRPLKPAGTSASVRRQLACANLLAQHGAVRHGNVRCGLVLCGVAAWASGDAKAQHMRSCRVLYAEVCVMCRGVE